MLPFLDNVWFKVGGVALVVFSVFAYGELRFSAGMQKERAAVQEQIAKAVGRAREAERRLAALQQQRQTRAEAEVRVVERIVRVGQEEIQNAPDEETQYAAYSRMRDGVRQHAASVYDRARADYLSTVAAAADGGARTSGPDVAPEPDSGAAPIHPTVPGVMGTSPGHFNP